jgi:hypothetical protein
MMKHARRNLSLRDADTAALSYAKRLQAGLNGIRLDEEGGGSDDDKGGGSDDDDDDGGKGTGGGSDDDEGGSGKSTGKGYPENTPVAEMTAEQQAAYWKAQSRKHEQRASQRSDYDEIRAKADRYDELEREKLSEVERAKEEGRTEGRKQATREAALKLVDAKIEAAAAGRVDGEQLDGALEFLDRTRFLDDNDEVDTDKVLAFVSSIAPATGSSDKGDDKKHPDLGQGRRKGGSKASVASGSDLYAQRHGSKN